MLIDLSCPAEVFQAAMPTEEIPAVSLLMYNLGDRVIVSSEVTVKLVGGNGSEKERVVFRGRALNGRPHSTFTMNVPCAKTPGAVRAEITIDKIWFSDNAVWRREAENSTEYIPNNLPISKGLTMLKYAAGETAVGYPSQQDGLWVCVCGRPNPDREDVCARCRRSKEMIFARFNREAVEKQVTQREKQLELNTRSVREDTARMQRIREEEFQQKQNRRKTRISLALCLVLFLAVTAGVLGAGAPALRLWDARREMTLGNWRAAAETLETLGDFPGAKTDKAACDREIAREMGQKAKTVAELAEASAALRAIPEDAECLETADALDLKRGRMLLEAGRISDAREAVSLIAEDNADRVLLEKDCLFAEASEEMAAGDYASAREKFLSLKDYGGAAEKAAECVYLPALDLMEDGLWTEAMAEFNRIPDYPESRRKILECHYHLGEEAERSGDLQTASSEYLMAGDWGDAEVKTRDTVFALAEGELAAGNLEQAQKLFASLPEYDAAIEKNRECVYQLAKKAMQKREYSAAMGWLTSLPENYQDVAELLPRCAYLAGTAAEKQKDWESASVYLEQAGDYKDTESHLTKVREELAQIKLNEGDAEGAMALIALIPESKNYKSLKQEADYQTAVAAAENGGEAEALIRQFEELGNYKDAKTWIQRLYYAQAEETERAGETLNAAQLYEKAGEFENAAEKAAELYDEYFGERAEAAGEAIDNQEYTMAIAILETLKRESLPEKYRNLNAMYEEACLGAGETLYNAGRPYEAKAYFEMIPENKKAQRWLGSACYLIIGAWRNRSGETVAEFRADGTCEINGEGFEFLVPDSYTVRTRKTGEEELRTTHRISYLTEERLTIRDVRAGNEKNWELYRVEKE